MTIKHTASTITRSLATLAIAVGLAAGMGACALDESPEEAVAVSALEAKSGPEANSACLESKAEFASWSDVEQCAKPSPALYDAALGAVLTAGAKCTAGTEKACVAVSGSDAIFAKWLNPWVGCWKDVTRGWPEGREYIECCFINDITGEQICDFAWINP
jgi:hypothetical protein